MARFAEKPATADAQWRDIEQAQGKIEPSRSHSVSRCSQARHQAHDAEGDDPPGAVDHAMSGLAGYPSKVNAISLRTSHAKPIVPSQRCDWIGVVT